MPKSPKVNAAFARRTKRVPQDEDHVAFKWPSWHHCHCTKEEKTSPNFTWDTIYWLLLNLSHVKPPSTSYRTSKPQRVMVNVKSSRGKTLW